MWGYPPWGYSWRYMPFSEYHAPPGGLMIMLTRDMQTFNHKAIEQLPNLIDVTPSFTNQRTNHLNISKKIQIHMNTHARKQTCTDAGTHAQMQARMHRRRHTCTDTDACTDAHTHAGIQTDKQTERRETRHTDTWRLTQTDKSGNTYVAR